MAKRELLIEADLDLRINESIWQTLDAHVEDVDRVVPLNFVLLTRAGPLEYDYRIRAADGRRWNQHFSFTSPTDTDPRMTFDTIGDSWKVTEFSVARPLRDTLIQLVVTFGIGSLRINFL